MRTPNLKAMQVMPLKGTDGKLSLVKPGDTNLRMLSRAAGYKLRGKSSYSNPGTKGKK